MRSLTPEFILEKLALGEDHGHFAAVVLFVDTSGFTPLTTALLHHGTEGAEIIAKVLAGLFTPLVEVVYQYGGFIAGFAGDAFKAIFPGMTQATYQQALTAAWQIRQQLLQQPVQQTRFGDFPFAIKVTVADGSIEWRIWQGKARGLAQQAATLFGGAALEQALAADPFATAGEVVMTSAVAAHLSLGRITLEPVDSHFRLCAWPEVPALPRPVSADGLLSALTAELATRFFPADLLTRQSQGEFRQVVTVFINLKTLPTEHEGTDFASTLFRLLAQYGGYLCRIGQIGDKDHGGTLLLFWGAPTSHEQNVMRALQFVVALQAAARSPLRAGVTTQLAYAGFVGSPRREEYTCYGAHVNLAARQMVMADWGEIWLDEETARVVGSAFECAHHGLFKFKGFSEERAIYRLLGRREVELESFYQGAMVGRQAELTQLATALAPLAEGQFAGVLTITGEAGMGKSRLVHELQQRGVGSKETEVRGAQQSSLRSVQWFLCQTDEILRQPLNPFRYWLRGYFHQSTSQSEAANKAAFITILDGLIATFAEATALVNRKSQTINLKAELSRTRSFLGALVDLHWPDSLYAQVEPQLRFENTLAALKTLILAESLRQPVILHLEDAHWLDADSYTLLTRLTRNVADYPLAVIITTRGGEERQGGEEDRGTESLVLEGPQVTIRLTTLTADEITVLAAVQLQGAPSPALVTLLEERAEGNPFFAEQLLRYLQEQGWLVQDADGWQLRTEQATATLLPNGARALLVARLDQLPQPVKEVVQTAAVLGREFDTNVLGQMLANDPTLADKLAVADRAAIWSAMTQVRYLFRHALLREAAYDMQLRARLRALHHLAGAALEQVYAADLTPYFGELAYHYDQAEAAETAVHWYGQAGEQASKQYANDAAARYFRRALALTPTSDVATRYPLLLGSEAVHNWLGKRQSQQDDLISLETVTEILNDDTKRSEVTLRKTAFHLSTGRYQEAAGYAEQAVAFAVQAGDTLAEARAYHRWGRAFWQAGEYQQALPYVEKALNSSRANQGLTEEALCLYDLAVIRYYQNQFEEALTKAKHSLALYEILGDIRGKSLCLTLTSVILDRIGNYTIALEQCEQALNLCRATGWRYTEARFLATSANIYLNVGNFHASRTLHEQVIRICTESGDREGIATSLDTLGLILYFSDHLLDAKRFYEEALTIHRAMNNHRGQGYVLTHLGFTLAELGEYRSAREALEQALLIRSKSTDTNLRLDTLAGFILLALKRHEPEQALPYVNEILKKFETSGADGSEFPVQIYLICYQLVNTLSISQPHYSTQAAQVLEAGYTFLQKRADAIKEPLLRQSFLYNMPFHHALVTLWQAQMSQARPVDASAPWPGNATYWLPGTTPDGNRRGGAK